MHQKIREPLGSGTTKIIGVIVLAVSVVLLGVFVIDSNSPGPTGMLHADGSSSPSSTDAQPPATKDSSNPTVAFIGDSYTAGAGASPGHTWPEILALSRGWDSYRSFAHGGTGYATSVRENATRVCGLDACPSYVEVLPAVIAYAPTLVIVSGGRNDTGKTLDQVALGASTLFDSLVLALPESSIVVTSPIWDARQPPATLDGISRVVRRAAENSNVYYLDLGQPFAGRPALITGDLVHPNDQGYELLSNAVSRGLSEAGVPAAPNESELDNAEG
ncbi:GDSL-type esterase/lipase family protein [Paeniglutamicibacter terrestris]|uniref:SGNH/GDSL hydrolase family protein n=1 Tax=Paeniglutamicibacter terrestris TaxID=2723403 RepID=A0ABX1G257_9MICC|nr:SGNH/GDSL hydrolase family protein [Paeniglutamicibacter terrestris]